jgi:integrase
MTSQPKKERKSHQRRTLTDSIIKNLKVKTREDIPDPQCAGHYVRAYPSGEHSFLCIARDPNGKQVWHTIGKCAHLTLEESRVIARQWIGRTKRGESTAGPETIDTVAADWIKRHLEANGVITKANKIRYLKNHILPAWGGREFRSIRRSDVAKLMDSVSDTAGKSAADEVLSIVRSIAAWYARRNDDYASPIIPGMRLTSTKERSRDRILTDDEIRKLWAVPTTSPILPIAKLLLLTGQRRTKVASMEWGAIDHGVWNVPAERRQKGTGEALRLPAEALAIIEAQPRFAHSLFVFPAQRGSGHFRAYSDGKNIIGGGWTLHDLRRTARSLMSRAGVRADIAERVLGHEQPGVAGVYDRHTYLEEKAEALTKLAALVRDIVNPPPANVVNMRKKLSRRA